MGGEKTLYSGMQQVVLGSSPRWRGKDRFLATQSLVLRITPAWAGKSSPLDYTSNLHTDHPRVGGEKPRPQSWQTASSGSPPRGRGKVPENRLIMRVCRITPAWAGKRRLSMLGCAASGDHPRVGGEKSAANTWPICCRGSPPRGRGKAIVPRSLDHARGITPAWAGKSAL